jgi:hypothetical protein
MRLLRVKTPGRQPRGAAFRAPIRSFIGGLIRVRLWIGVHVIPEIFTMESAPYQPFDHGSPGNLRIVRVVSLSMRRTFVLAALLLFSASLSHACSCFTPNPICSAYWQTPVVFRGKVIGLTLVSHTETPVKNLDGSTSTVISPGFIRAHFSVLETFKGTPQREITILTNEQSSACGFSFEEGGEYVVFAFAKQASDELWTSKCSLTHKLEAGKEDTDLTWMRGLLSAPGGATIFGKLVPPRGLESKIPSPWIAILGPEVHRAVPDKNGHYAFNGLSPGEYTVSAVMPPGFAAPGERKLTVADKGCAQVDWEVLYDSHIRGRITDAAGHPLQDIAMALKRRDSRMATGFADVNLGGTDSDGRYDFSRVPPGDYLISANNLGPSPTRPYPRVYYPNADSDLEAAEVHLAPSGILEDIDITLPNAWKPVTVHTRVLQPDGSPATGAEIFARDIDYLWSVEPATATAGPDGRAVLSVYERRIYYLTSTMSGGTQQRCAGPLRFAAKDGAVLDAITVEHNWGNCLAQLNPNFRPPR